jgi:hypothetical protein
MRLPCTTRLSFDFLRSRVSISRERLRLAGTERQAMLRRTMASELKVEDIADANVDDTKKPLIAPLELALIENLDGYHGRVLDSSGEVAAE